MHRARPAALPRSANLRLSLRPGIAILFVEVQTWQIAVVGLGERTTSHLARSCSSISRFRTAGSTERPFEQRSCTMSAYSISERQLDVYIPSFQTAWCCDRTRGLGILP